VKKRMIVKIKDNEGEREVELETLIVVFCVMTPVLLRVVTNVSEDCVASIFRVV
jgi:hypothetical protein